jgi:TolB-like protein/tetratricopeptide (TPR) repeat protein
MSSDTSLSNAPGANVPAQDRLDSWKEIAAYLHREVRTVQRWEKSAGLPVHRVQIEKQSAVYAYKSELDAWYKARQPRLESEDAEEEEGSSLEPHPFLKFVRPKLRLIAIGLAVVLILPSSAYFLRKRLLLGRPRISTKIRLAVLPFKNLSGDPQQEFFSAGLTDEMTTQLGRLDPERLGVIAATSSRVLGDKPIGELGRILNLQYAVEGSVRRGGNQVRIDVELIQLSDQTHLWADSYTGDAGDILRLQDEVTAAVARQIRVALPVGALGINGSKGTARVVNPQAYDDYLRGRFYWTNRGDLHKSIQAYQQAIHKDPDYALAYAGLASAYALLGQVPYDDMSPAEAKPKARDAAKRALELDPQVGEAHSVLGNVAFSYDWDFQAAEREFQLALAAGQNDPTAHLWFSHYLTARNRPQQAHEENSRTLALDPVSPLFNTVRAEIFYHSRQYDAAIDQARRTIDQYPSYWLTYIWLGSSYREKKMYPEALEQFSQALKLSSDHPAIIALYGHTQAVSGNSAGARKSLAVLQHLATKRYVSSLYFAAIHSGLGEKSAALDWLDKAYKERNDRLVYLAVDPIADPLRSEPRFRNLLTHIGLP